MRDGVTEAEAEREGGRMSDDVEHGAAMAAAVLRRKGQADRADNAPKDADRAGAERAVKSCDYEENIRQV